MKKRKYSNPQKLYMIAKANLEVIENEHNASETAFIKSKGITNPDGTTPELLYMIEDGTEMETMGAEFDEIPEIKQMWMDILAAREALKIAEAELIDYALNVVPIPQKIKVILTESAKTSYTTRQKVIDIVMDLDVTTLPKHLVLR